MHEGNSYNIKIKVALTSDAPASIAARDVPHARIRGVPDQHFIYRGGGQYLMHSDAMENRDATKNYDAMGKQPGSDTYESKRPD